MLLQEHRREGCYLFGGWAEIKHLSPEWWGLVCESARMMRFGVWVCVCVCRPGRKHKLRCATTTKGHGTQSLLPAESDRVNLCQIAFKISHQFLMTHHWGCSHITCMCVCVCACACVCVRACGEARQHKLQSASTARGLWCTETHTHTHTHTEAQS